ncbi:hypothetical protein [Kitasatospora sp. CB01950]|nr:hypothetical protein [Kitasatospora sp. CB01950]
MTEDEWRQRDDADRAHVDRAFDNASIGTVGRPTVTVTPLGPVTD